MAELKKKIITTKTTTKKRMQCMRSSTKMFKRKITINTGFILRNVMRSSFVVAHLVLHMLNMGGSNARICSFDL